MRLANADFFDREPPAQPEGPRGGEPIIVPFRKLAFKPKWMPGSGVRLNYFPANWGTSASSTKSLIVPGRATIPPMTAGVVLRIWWTRTKL